MLNKKSNDIYYWFVKILCHFALLNFKTAVFSFQQIDKQIKTADLKHEGLANKLQLFSKLTFISISLNANSYYFCKNKYLNLVAEARFLSDRHRNMHELNSHIMESLFLFKNGKYHKMLEISVPKLDIHNYIFEGNIMYHYVDLLLARGKAFFKLNNLDKAFDYFSFIINNKAKFKTNYKIFLSKNKINFELEKTLLKFMNSVGKNYKKKNVINNLNKLTQSLENLKLKPIEKHLIEKLGITSILKDFPLET